MRGNSNRMSRVSDLLKKEIALLIQAKVQDPRVGMTSVTAVKVSNDLSCAEVYVTFLGGAEADLEQRLATLNKASGYLRSLLTRQVSLRRTPRLRFRYDESLARGRRLTELIDAASPDVP